MVPHCPILSTKLKRLAAEQVSFTLSAASLFLCPQILQCVFQNGHGSCSPSLHTLSTYVFAPSIRFVSGASSYDHF